VVFELPEFVTLSKQINATLIGKRIISGELGNSPHKFLWYNRTHEEFKTLTSGKVIGETWSKGKWLFIPLEPGYVLVLGECGGKVLFHPPGSELPKKYHLSLTFEDGCSLTAMTQMWGAMELYQKGEEQNREYIKGMRTTPNELTFTFEYFNALLAELGQGKRRSAKSLLTQDQLIPGLGNAIAQDILFRAQLDPRHPIEEMDVDQRQKLYGAIVTTVQDVIEKGGRADEFDLFGGRGGYARLMDRNTVGNPCPRCRAFVEKIQYLGGACYFCPNCQE
jgi:formamidopyrimidine-DNA glycosylase